MIIPSIRENVCNNSKNLKSHVLYFEEKKRKKRPYSFTGHLLTRSLITQ